MTSKQIFNYRTWLCNLLPLKQLDSYLKKTYRVCRTLQYSRHMPGQRRPGPRVSLPQDGWHHAPRHRRPPHTRTGQAPPGPGHSLASEPSERGTDVRAQSTSALPTRSSCAIGQSKDRIFSRLQGTSCTDPVSSLCLWILGYPVLRSRNPKQQHL